MATTQKALPECSLDDVDHVWGRLQTFPYIFELARARNCADDFHLDGTPAAAGALSVLPTRVTLERWHVDLAHLSAFLDRDRMSILRERGGRRQEIEIRRPVYELKHDATNGELLLTLLLGQGRTPRPSDIVRGIYGPDAASPRIEREEVLAWREEALVSPLVFCGPVSH